MKHFRVILHYQWGVDLANPMHEDKIHWNIYKGILSRSDQQRADLKWEGNLTCQSLSQLPKSLGFSVPCLSLLLNGVHYYFCLQWKFNGLLEKSRIWKRLSVLSPLASWHMGTYFPPGLSGKWCLVFLSASWKNRIAVATIAAEKLHVPTLLLYLPFNMILIFWMGLVFFRSPTKSCLYLY